MSKYITILTIIIGFSYFKIFAFLPLASRIYLIFSVIMEKIDTITIQQFSVKHAENDLGWRTGNTQRHLFRKCLTMLLTLSNTK
jgi:hypothetical protein